MAGVTNNLFSWDAVEARSDLERFYLVRDHLPDEAIIAALEAKRGQGRDDYPVRAMWNAVVAGVVFQHPSGEALLRELKRNPALLAACGFDALPHQKAPVAQLIRDEVSAQMKVSYAAVSAPYYPVPSSWNLSRFLVSVVELEEQQGLVSAMLVTLREQLMEVLADFGRHLGFDGKAIDSHSTGQVNRQTEQTSDPDADWGKHETRGVDAQGKPWSKIKSWFGYGLHLIADTRYELPVAFHLTPASHSEQLELRALIKETFAQPPELAERCDDFSVDRGLDGGATKALLWDTYRIRPLIDTRELWRDEKQAPDYDPSQPITRPLDPERADTIVHTEKGTVVSARSVARSAIWRFKASSLTVTRSNTAVRRPPTASTARVGHSAIVPEEFSPATTGGLSVSTSPNKTGGSSSLPRTAVPAGGAAIIAAVPWSGSTIASITVSALSCTSFAVAPR